MMYTHYRIEESTGAYYFPWAGLYTCVEDARKQLELIVRRSSARRERLRIVRYEAEGWQPAVRAEVVYNGGNDG